MKRILSFVAVVFSLFLSFLGASSMAQNTAPVAADTATGNNAFAGDLYAQLNKSGAAKNLFFSPYSISAALGMTAQGAKGKTADQMNQVLHIGRGFQAGMAEMTTALKPKGAPFELSVANALWVDQSFPLAPAFVADCQKNYDAVVNGVDFVRNADAVRQQINAAVAAQTHDKIKDLLPPDSIDGSTALVLTDAIYFKGTWQTPFLKEATSDQPFHAPGGDVNVSLMRAPSGTLYGYSETDDCQVLSLPYKGAPNSNPATGVPAGPGTLSMVVILPRKVDGLAELEKQATVDNLAKWTANFRHQPVQVFLPRFTMTFQFELSKELKALGMTEAFTRGGDFSGISATAGNKLMISAVIHKAFVDVNEEGTEAAAATAVPMARATARPGNPAVFRADHPFLFMIRHEPTGAVLFLGHVVNPK